MGVANQLITGGAPPCTNGVSENIREILYSVKKVGGENAKTKQYIVISNNHLKYS
jgi:hypothetical protein